MITDGLNTFKGRRVLLLQGPVGPFFKRFSRDLQNAGCTVFKINFNGGDFVFYPTQSTQYRGDSDEWPVFFERFVLKNKIDLIFLFGDCRPVHKSAHGIAKSLCIEVGVFEEGYIRPDYITLERDGVNGNSKLPLNIEFYTSLKKTKVSKPKKIGNTYTFIVLWAIIYYLFSALFFPIFRRYTHHRPLTILESLPWIKSMWRSKYYKYKEMGIEGDLVNNYHKKYFLVPLQAHNDSQIHEHSSFYSVSEFIKCTIDSFANHALDDHVLVIKHHPMDRGYHDYTKLIRELSFHYGIRNRIFYIHDQHLPSLLNSALGVVVVNSTVGLSALHRLLPVKVCGSSIYSIENIVYTGDLSRFWVDSLHFSPDREAVESYLAYLVDRNQFNGSFYRGSITYKL